MNSIEIQIIPIAAALVISFILFVSIDLVFNLPKSGSTHGIAEMSRAITRHGGDKAGGMMMGNILLSAICGLILAGTSIYLMRKRFHVLLERYEFSFIWLAVLVIAGSSIYHVIIGVLS